MNLLLFLLLLLPPQLVGAVTEIVTAIVGVQVSLVCPRNSGATSWTRSIQNSNIFYDPGSREPGGVFLTYNKSHSILGFYSVGVEDSEMYQFGSCTISLLVQNDSANRPVNSDNATMLQLSCDKVYAYLQQMWPYIYMIVVATLIIIIILLIPGVLKIIKSYKMKIDQRCRNYSYDAFNMDQNINSIHTALQEIKVIISEENQQRKTNTDLLIDLKNSEVVKEDYERFIAEYKELSGKTNKLEQILKNLVSSVETIRQGIIYTDKPNTLVTNDEYGDDDDDESDMDTK